MLEAAISTFRSNKGLADKAIAQLADNQLHQALDPRTNCIAVIMKHIAGNLISRWTDFLTTDGEKPWRNRDDEFVDSFTGRAEVLEYWESGWKCLFDSLASLSDNDMDATVVIRGEAQTAGLALQRSLAHCAYHIGQIVLIARILANENWTTLTIPRGGSRAFNEQSWGPAKPSGSKSE